MKKGLKIDFQNKQIIMTAKFFSRAQFVDTEEYELLQKCRKENPGFEVVRRTIKKCVGKQSFKGLTYEYMEKYISTHADAGMRMREYQKLRLASECRAVKYSAIRSWFLKTYPELRKEDNN